MAGGSQLKKLKESLKTAGLVNKQQAVKKGKKSKKTEEKMSKEEHQSALQSIREQFNPFDVKVAKNKRADALAKQQTVGKPGVSKQAGEDRRKMEWEAKMARKNKSGGLVDRRFGEHNKHMSAEEKMLERFTKSKLAQANKRSIYNLEDNEEDDDIDTLTHMGQRLEDENEEDSDSGPLSGGEVDDDNDDDFFSKKRPSKNGSAEHGEEGEEGPQRKKTKAEVMKEVMAKSKYYKQLRQRTHEKTMEKVGELDDAFEDVMDEIVEVAKQLPSDTTNRSEKDLEYEMKVTEAKLDKKAAPSDRTKTEEEVEKEESDRLKTLEEERQRRMEGEDLDEGDRGADDLDDGYWEQNSDDEANGFTIGNSDEEFVAGSDEDEDHLNDDIKDSDNTNKRASKNTITIGNKVFHLKSTSTSVPLVCPASLEEFKNLIQEKLDFNSEVYHQEIVKLILQIFEKYQPKLAEGNKEKLASFSVVLLSFYLTQADQGDLETASSKDYVEMMEFLSRTTKDLVTKYPSEFLAAYRDLLENAQFRLTEKRNKYPKISDLLLLAQIGRTFSTSDKFHLVVVPALILASESLESFTMTSSIDIVSGAFISDVLLRYQRVAKRFIPEISTFLERSLIALVPNPNELQISKLLTQSTTPSATSLTLPAHTELSTSKFDLPLSLTQLFANASGTYHKNIGVELINILLNTLDQITSLIWKETEAAPEILTPFIHIVQHLVKSTAPAGNPLLINLASKLSNINRLAIQSRKPIQLQSHRAVAIATYAPRFDESFNPDKKNAASKYVDPNDPASVNAEISKLKHQLKQERKQTMREIRKDSRFEARIKIDKQKKEHEEYHAKMAKIVNTIQAEEGTEKNLHEREKQRRKDAKK